jgi:predicted MFS family arabinose efflux permease
VTAGAREPPAATRAPAATGDTAHLPARLRLAFLAGPMLSMIDSSVVNVAVPVIVRGLHTTLGTAAWAVSGYLLGLACGLAATPWLARRFGTLPAYGAAMLAFTLASGACALVPSVGLLIAARVIQGLAGAPMVPLAMSLILDPKRGARSMPASAGILLFAAPALGPALGGLLIGGFGWRSVFLINVPVGLAALAATRAARRALPGGTGDRSARLDGSGLVLLAAGLGLATYGASQGPAHGWLSAASAPAWAGGLALVAGYVLRERATHASGHVPRERATHATGHVPRERAMHPAGHVRRERATHPPGGGLRRPPAVDLSPLRSPQRALTLALACVASVVLFAMLFLAPVFLQQIQHHSATVTGLVLLPQGVVMGLASWLGSILAERGKQHPRVITVSVAGGLALLAASTLGLLLLTATTPVWVTTGLLCGRGVALGLTIQPLVKGFIAGLDERRMPDASTLFNMAERLSGSFGIALLATLYASRAAATGSGVTAFRDCALVLTIAAGIGAGAAACNHGMSVNDAG